VLIAVVDHLGQRLAMPQNFWLAFPASNGSDQLSNALASSKEMQLLGI